jgi:hypothetical protein
MTLLDIQIAINEINAHYAVLNDDYSELSKNVAVLTAQFELYAKLFWLVLATSLTTLAGIIINLFRKK